jgi:hypothetical protein
MATETVRPTVGDPAPALQVIAGERHGAPLPVPGDSCDRLLLVFFRGEW